MRTTTAEKREVVNRVYLQLPLRKSRYNPKVMQIFYAVLGLFWIGSGISFFFARPVDSPMMPVLYLAIGAGMLLLAYNYESLFSGRYVESRGEGMIIKLGFRRPVFVRWEEIDKVQLDDHHFSVIRRDGSEQHWKINRRAMYNWSEFIRSLEKTLAEKDVAFSF